MSNLACTLVADVESGNATSSVDLGAAYEESDQCQVTRKQLDEIKEDLISREQSGRRVYSRPVKYATNFFWQVHAQLEGRGHGGDLVGDQLKGRGGAWLVAERVLLPARQWD